MRLSQLHCLQEPQAPLGYSERSMHLGTRFLYETLTQQVSENEIERTVACAPRDCAFHEFSTSLGLSAELTQHNPHYPQPLMEPHTTSTSTVNHENRKKMENRCPD